MNFKTTLKQLGVRDNSLSGDERQFLDQHGYLMLPGFLSAEQVQAFRNRLAELSAVEPAGGRVEEGFQGGTVILPDLVNKDPMFEICFTHPRILAAIDHVVPKGFKLSSLVCRWVQPDGGKQPLHADWHPAWWRDRKQPSDHFACNSLWMLDDFTVENGATRVVPGSHLGLTSPEDEMEDSEQPHPRENRLLGAAGTVVIFTGHTWHAGMLNKTATTRCSVLSYFCRRDQQQQLDQREALQLERRRRLSEAALDVLDAR